MLLTSLLTFLLPGALLTRIISYHLRRGNGKSTAASQCCVQATLNLLNPRVVGNAMYLAYTELLDVREVDEQTIRDNVEKIR